MDPATLELDPATLELDPATLELDPAINKLVRGMTGRGIMVVRAVTIVLMSVPGKK